ncbi:MAG TPA: hypothetical protein PLT08_10760 [Anaerolineales bacterium]|nr:hypothetical protein [Anaerolineales bacterium]
MKKHENKNNNDTLVECPFCGLKVYSRNLAKHAKLLHAGTKKPSQTLVAGGSYSINGVEIQNKDLAQSLNQLVVDENGVLINPKLLQEEARISRNEVMGTAQKPKQQLAKSKKEQNRTIYKINQKHKSIDELYREKEEWLKKIPQLNSISKNKNALIVCPVCNAKVKSKRLWRHFAKNHQGIHLTNEQINKLENGEITKIDLSTQRKPSKINHPVGLSRNNTSSDENEISNLVKCPLCKHKTFYNVLFTHIQVSHPEVNPKIMMAKFNKVYRNKNTLSNSNYEKEINEVVKEYEKLKQGQDETRDGGKYLGFMRRESGKFGSLPLYDDYSDDADAE